ncbi:PTS transporter subunit EIIC [Pleomorphomonas sp. NRK KF1]|uniref:PTS transporter subunit EIIC n=1 Tax=Pleomorphomonas sp. NRK KF1 TaxID=2943000 RepID=UPI0020445F4B|nr:PTS transporter subunit EIIC [Pleomorphomonas sp. NRK KF1]
MSNDLNGMAKAIVAAVGGEANVSALVHCATRLRFTLKDEAKADKAALQAIKGVVAVVQSGGQYQVVIGNTVPDVFDAISKVTSINADAKPAQVQATEAAVPGEKAGTGKTPKQWLDVAIATISGIFAPMLTALCGGGMLKGLMMIATAAGWLDPASGTHAVLNAASDSVFYFLPMLLAVTSARRFECNPYVAMVIAGALIYPDIIALAKAGDSTTMFGITFVPINYTSTVIPIILAIYVMSKLEKFSVGILHSAVRPFLGPMISIGLIVPATLLVIGPAATMLSGAFASAYIWLFGVNPILAGAIFGGLWQILVIFGLHWGLVPVMLNNMTVFKQDGLAASVTPAIFAQAGATLGVFLKTRDPQMKAIAAAAAASGIFGITEPAIYGVNLRFKRPFIIGIVAGVLGGAVVAVAGAASHAMAPPGLLTLPVFMGEGFVTFLITVAVAYFGAAIATYLFGYNDRMLEAEKKG